VKLAINNIFFTFHLGEPSTSGICSLIVFGSAELGVLLNQLGVAKLQLSGIRNEGSKSCEVDLKVHFTCALTCISALLFQKLIKVDFVFLKLQLMSDLLSWDVFKWFKNFK